MRHLSLVLGFLGLAVITSTALGGCAVYSAPPPRYEVVAVGSPGPGYVWEPGHWVRYRHGDVWVRGHWRRY